MRSGPRSRTRLATQVAAWVVLGLASRWPHLPEFCILYVGDVLWGALFLTLAAWLAPAATTPRLWASATAAVEVIELSQLYQAPWAQEIRATALGGLLLGHSFSWSDVLCVALGTSAAALFVVPFSHGS